MSDIFNLTDTWNNVGTTFSAIKMDVTDTASAAGSLLLDLRVGGTAKFQVKKDGTISLASGSFITPLSAAAVSAYGLTLIDDADAATARGTLGCGTAATAATGTSGATLPFLNAVNTWSAKQNSSAIWASNSGFELYNGSVTTNINLQVGGFGVFMCADMSMLWNSQSKGAVNIFGGGSTDTGVSRDSAGVVRISNGSTGGGALKTADPTSGVGPAWKFGAIKAAAVALDTANYIEVDIGGTLKKILIAS